MSDPTHDGSSQASRLRPELDPAHAVLDERTMADDLAFARAYAAGLVFVDASGEPRGDWQAMFPAPDALREAVDYLRAPERFDPERAAPYARPHFALLLAFLELLGLARGQLNAFSQRHLDHYYREVLHMVRKPAIADRVHLLLRPDDRQARLQVPAGTVMRGGKDALGGERLFRTLSDLTASPVRLAAMCSLRTHIRRTGIAQASRRYLQGGTRDEAFLAMLRITLGDPLPGDDLPVPLLPGLPAPAAAGAPVAVVDFDTLQQAFAIVDFVGRSLYLPLYDDFRQLMRLRNTRLQDDPRDWARINALLQAAGRRRDPAFQLVVQRADDFDANLRAALGLQPDAYAKLYDHFPEVTRLEDVHARMSQDDDLKAFVLNTLHLPLDDFHALMQTKLRMDGQWREIVRLIETAGRRRDPALQFTPALRQLRDVDRLLTAALGTPAWPPPVSGGLGGLHQAFEAIEQYFGMSAEGFHFVMTLAQRTRKLPATVQASTPADEADWARVHAICTDAHVVVRVRRRRERLLRVLGAQPARRSGSQGLSDMLALALGAPIGLGASWSRLDGLGMGTNDVAWLQGLAATEAPAPADWQRAAEMLEVVQRNREGLEIGPPEQRIWHHTYPAMDARQMLAPGQAADEPAPRWRPFGSLDAAWIASSEPVAALGWAVSSPLLAMAEGQRNVTLVLGLDGDPAHFDGPALRRLLAPPDGASAAAGYNPFQVQLSGPEGWIDPTTVQLGGLQPGQDGYPAVQNVDTTGLRALVIRCVLDAQQAAVVPPSLALHGMAAGAPALRLMLRPVWSEQWHCHHTAYQALAGLRVRRLQLSVKVAGLATLALQNDQSVLDPKKPFEPFGASPDSGARLSIGHPELVGKALDSIVFHGTWMGVPDSLTAHYANYRPKASALTGKSFTALIGLRDGTSFSAAPNPLGLFGGADTAGTVRLAPVLPADGGRLMADADPARDVHEWRRCWVWELSGDFQHAVYPAKALKLSLQLAAAVAAGQKPGADDYVLNPPYTPKLKSLVVDYSASAEQAAVAEDGAVQAATLHHLLPFGQMPLQPGAGWAIGADVPLLPVCDAEGELCIGLAGVQAPQRLSLLIQAAEGSADPDAPAEPVQWSVLSGNRWLSLHEGPLEGSLLADGTRGLVDAGIVELQLPPVSPSSLMAQARPLDGQAMPAGGLYWLRLRRARVIEGVCDLVALHPHAVQAERLDAAAAGDDLAQPLPAGQISAPVDPVRGLAAVVQPYSSFGGRPAERARLFETRVSERLRHRQRALTPWDYEHLVLEQFPQLYKAKCLRADEGSGAEPGTVTLVVVPDITQRFPFDPFAPKVSAALILDIQAFLADKLPASARVRVCNAHFVALKVRCGVRFRPGTDEGWCRQQLNDDLNRFLSPWAYQGGADLVIGGSIYANSIIDFIEQRPYVDFIAGLRMFTGEAGRFTLVPDGAEHRAGTQRADAVLVAAAEHELDVIAANDYRVQAFGGIGNMRIELDFSVA